MEDVITRAQANYKRDLEHWGEIYEKAKEDLRFLSDEEGAQWNDKLYQQRKAAGRQVLTVDQLSQFIHQVANDIRMNTPAINIIPEGGEADVETAEIFQGLIRSIEYKSNADDAYDTAALNAIKCSIGFIRVDHDYVSEDSFEQELIIRRVVNPLACVIDSSTVECDGRDAGHGTILDKILVSDFEKEYPKFKPVCFLDSDRFNPKQDDEISIAEYFEIEDQLKEIGITEFGQVEEVIEGKMYASRRKVTKKVVKHYKLSGADILGETTFPGKYIPLVPVYGEEAWIEGKRNLFSLIRKSKEAQQMYNLWKSLETEILLKQPNAPVMAAEGQVDDYAADWLNPDKSMVLRYKTVDANGNPISPPQRLAPPSAPAGIVTASRGMSDDIKATMGLYSASIGQRSNETSGVAIERRNQEGDVATFHFQDNTVRSITQVGRICVAAAPEVYDTPRIIQYIGEEDEPKEIGINGHHTKDQVRDFFFSKGIYGVRVTTGAPFTTLRQEAAQVFTQIVDKRPEMLGVMGDLLFKNMDFPGAQAMAERMKKFIDPKFLDENKDQDPEKEQLKAALQQAQQVMGQMQEKYNGMEQQLKNKEAETAIKAQSSQQDAINDERKFMLDADKLELEKQIATKDAGFRAAEISIKNRELDVREAEAISAMHLNQENHFNERADAASQELGNQSPDNQVGAL